MEDIIKKAVEGGYESLNNWSGCVLDPLFWVSLGKACGWNNEVEIRSNVFHSKGLDHLPYTHLSTRNITSQANFYALTFMGINLTEGWDKSVEYLQEITK